MIAVKSSAVVKYAKMGPIETYSTLELVSLTLYIIHVPEPTTLNLMEIVFRRIQTSINHHITGFMTIFKEGLASGLPQDTILQLTYQGDYVTCL